MKVCLIRKALLLTFPQTYHHPSILFAQAKNSYLKACLISCSISSPLNLSRIMMVNSEKSNFPLWSTSISFMMFMISSSVGFRPRVRISTPNSLALMKPSPFCKKGGKNEINMSTSPHNFASITVARKSSRAKKIAIRCCCPQSDDDVGS